MIRLKDVAYYVTDKIRTAEITPSDYISTENMVPNRRGISLCSNPPESEKVCHYSSGDILISNIRPYFKKIWYANRTGGCSNDVLVLRTKTEAIDSLYLYYVLSQSTFFDHMMAGANGTKMPRGNKAEILEFSIPEMELHKQINIATILSSYDKLIENSQKQIILLEEAAQRLYKGWFVDLRFPGYEHTPIVDGVPSGWKLLSLEEIAPILTGKKDANFSTDDGRYPFFTCAQEPLLAPSYSFDCDAVILAGNGDFNVKLYRGQFEAYQRTYVLSPNNKGYLFLLFHAVSNSMTKLAQGASGSTIKFLTKGMIASIPIFLPDEHTLCKFNVLREAIQQQIETLRATIANAVEARDRLLPKLMNGEIEV